MSSGRLHEIIRHGICCSCALLSAFAVFHADANAQTAVPALRLRAITPATAAPAQNIVPADPGVQAQTPPASNISGEDEHPLVAPPPGGNKPSPRLQAFLQVTFDRRPSTILSAWSDLELGLENGQAAAAVAGTASNPAAVSADISAELKAFQKHVTLGDWGEVKAAVASFSPHERKKVYAHLLQSLAAGPPLTPEKEQQISQMPQMREAMEANVFSGEDIFGLAAAAHGAWEKFALQSLGQILSQSIAEGLIVDDFLVALRTATSDDAQAPGKLFTRKDAVHLLSSAGQIRSLAEFLPEIDEAEQDGDIESLTLISQYCMSMYGVDGDKSMLRRAWLASQASLAVPDASSDVRTAAIRQAVELAPQVEEQGGETWLAESFTENPERGMQILAVIGAGAATGLEQYASNPSYRQKSLELQKTAVEALLESAPERAAEWAGTLNVLARVWLSEAEFATRYNTSSSRNPVLQRDVYGNLYYVDPNQQLNQAGQVRALSVKVVMETRPNEEWVALLEDTLRPKLTTTTAMLHLRVNEDKEAFPYIEELAPTHPDQATQLAREFIRVWTRNHNPNQSTTYTNPYSYIYGFDVKAQSIPLTRSKQERNLQELADWIARLRALKLDDIDENLLTTAFTTCHSTAEVYRLEAIEKVFGSLDKLEPDTLASLSQRMRQNLAGVWRDPATQQTASTNRKKQDLEAEVKAGYVVAHQVLDAGIEKYPTHWGLQLAKASLTHDENDYTQELSRSSEYAPRRGEAFAEFAKAAELYAAEVPSLKTEEESTQVYEVWFYAALGACDPGGITHEKVPDLRQIEHIRAAMESLDGEASQRHLDSFANLVFTRMSSLNPAVKSRYLDAAFEIVGDNERAFEARKVHQYYADLIQELKLETVIDGSDTVGKEPFGVFVNLVHTPEIERESGGFGKYLQNQNNVMYAYNYGRPLENYRDKFRDAAVQALNDHFEVMSVTFQAEDVSSKAIADEYGWRKTPYAYILLKARDDAVDKFPPLRLDLDFLDTSGYVVLPIESPQLPLDCRSAAVERPLDNVQITQTLDERQAKDGKLILEVKASGHGLIPELEELVDLDFPGFEIKSTEDDGVSVSRFDPESRDNVVISERLWLITMESENTGEAAPAEFTFASTSRDAKTSFQRYVDADLEDVESTISLESQYGETSYAWVWWLVAGGLVLGVAGIFSLRALSRPKQESAARFQVPDRISPFTVVTLLRDIEENNGLDDPTRNELKSTIVEIERSYFDRESSDGPDLRDVAVRWVKKTN